MNHTRAAMVISVAIIVGYGIIKYSGKSSVPEYPVFSLINLQTENEFFTNEDLSGKPFLINAWASWCVPCQTEYSNLRSFANHDIIRVHGLNYKDKANDANLWLDFYGNVFDKNGFDPDGQVTNDFGITVVPTSILFDAERNIVYKHTGPITEEIVRNILIPLASDL